MEFLLEAYAVDAAAAELRADCLRRSARKLRVTGTTVRVVRAIFLPEEETSLVLFEAPSVDAVRAAVADAGLAADRIVVAVLSPAEQSCA
ncbi:MAG: hypothetical protein U0R50_06245 [Gaiellales bacterium]